MIDRRTKGVPQYQRLPWVRIPPSPPINRTMYLRPIYPESSLEITVEIKKTAA